MTEWRTTPAEELAERLASANADRHRLEVLYEEARREQHRWEYIAAERGTRMDELQARAETAEAENARLREAVKVCGRHLYDCCRTDIDWKLQIETHDQAVRAVAWAEAQQNTPLDAPTEYDITGREQ